jgi:TRAP-type mannitol/chloroaromatic compound transport system permease small subunit
MVGRVLSGALSRSLLALQWLVIPIGLLLFLQWPLREFFRAYSREANDLGQLLFAVYVTASVTAATRAGTHLATDALAQRYSARTRRNLTHLCNLLALAPWAIFIAVSATPIIRGSISHWERFADTGNPGYFIIKLSLWLLALGVLAAIALDSVGRGGEDER